MMPWLDMIELAVALTGAILGAAGVGLVMRYRRRRASGDTPPWGTASGLTEDAIRAAWRVSCRLRDAERP